MLSSLSRRAMLGAMLAAPALAQTRNGTIVFPFAPGSGGDATSRFIAEKFQAALNHSFIVENKTGGNGRIGIAAVKNAALDSRTFLVTTGPTMSIYPLFYPNLGFDVIRDFTPISRLSDFEFALAVSKNAPINSLAELKDYLIKNPEKANSAVPSLGTLPHFFSLRLAELMGIKIQAVPYRGSSPVVQSLVADQVTLGITPLSDFLPQHEGKNLKIIAVFSDKRSPFLSEVATAREQQFEIVGKGWYGLWAPANMEKNEQAMLNALIVKEFNAPSGLDYFKKLGLIVNTSTPQALNDAQNADMRLWAPLIAASGFKPEQ